MKQAILRGAYLAITLYVIASMAAIQAHQVIPL